MERSAVRIRRLLLVWLHIPWGRPGGWASPSTFRGSGNGWSCVPYHCGRSSTLLLQKVRDHIGWVLNVWPWVDPWWLSWRIFLANNRTIDPHYNRDRKMEVIWIKVILNTEKEETHKIFLRENLNRENNHRKRRRFYYNSQLQELHRICWYVFELGLIRREEPPPAWRRRSTYTQLSAWRRMRCWPDLYNCMICTYYLL